jgi:hypothetical protein
VRSIFFASVLVACGAPPASRVDPPAPPIAIADDAGADDAAITEIGPSFLGAPDAPILEVLARSGVTRIERGTGGRSVGFRLTFEDGSRGYFKPEQTFSGSHFYAEIASYHLDRMLGLGRVPPTIGRRLAWAPLRALVGRERASEVIVRGDEVCGSLSWWVPEPLVRLSVGLGWEAWARFSPPLAVSPFQRARVYAIEASGGAVVQDASETRRAADAPDVADRAAELSDMVLFDYLTENIDRWGGGYTNVRTRGDAGPLVFLDNAAGFIEAPQASPGFMDARLHAIQRFRRSTVEAIRALSIDGLRERVEHDACAPILNARFYAQLEERRVALLAHVDRMIAEHGETAIAW